jgi:hypothetical protein
MRCVRLSSSAEIVHVSRVPLQKHVPTTIRNEEVMHAASGYTDPGRNTRNLTCSCRRQHPHGQAVGAADDHADGRRAVDEPVAHAHAVDLQLHVRRCLCLAACCATCLQRALLGRLQDRGARGSRKKYAVSILVAFYLLCRPVCSRSACRLFMMPRQYTTWSFNEVRGTLRFFVCLSGPPSAFALPSMSPPDLSFRSHVPMRLATLCMRLLNLKP